MKTPAILLDIHAHLIPLRPERMPATEGLHWSDAGTLVVDGADLANAQIYRPQALIDWMDQHGVARAWVSVPPTLYRATLDAEAATQWSRAINEALTDVSASHSTRLACLYHLPMQHPQAAAGIARDAVARGQLRFAMPASDPQGQRLLSEASYQPLWDILDKARAFLFLHPGRACDGRFNHFSLMNLLGGPTETALAAAHLAMSGVAERHPDITFCLAHGGGTLPAAAGRIQRGQDTGRAGAYLGGQKVREAFRRFCADCITHDAGALQQAAATFGAGRILFGSDWPFGMGLPDPHAALDGVDAALRERIFESNPRALLQREGEPG